MSTDDPSDRLREVFRTVFDDPSFELEDDVKMGDTEAWDSFNQINLMLGIESEFGIEFDSDEIGELLSVGAIRGALAHRLATDRSA